MRKEKFGVLQLDSDNIIITNDEYGLCDRGNSLAPSAEYFLCLHFLRQNAPPFSKNCSPSGHCSAPPYVKFKAGLY